MSSLNFWCCWVGRDAISRMVLVSSALLPSQELLSLASATKRPKPTQSSGSDSSSESGSDDEVSHVPVTWGWLHYTRTSWLLCVHEVLPLPLQLEVTYPNFCYAVLLSRIASHSNLTYLHISIVRTCLIVCKWLTTDNSVKSFTKICLLEKSGISIAVRKQLWLAFSLIATLI